MPRAALLNAAYALFHVPDLVRYGSKPTRELRRDPDRIAEIERALRPFPQALAYPPNQVFIGNLTPEQLAEIERPWHQRPVEGASPRGPLGRILDQAAFIRA